MILTRLLPPFLFLRGWPTRSTRLLVPWYLTVHWLFPPQCEGGPRHAVTDQSKVHRSMNTAPPCVSHYCKEEHPIAIPNVHFAFLHFPHISRSLLSWGGQGQACVTSRADGPDSLSYSSPATCSRRGASPELHATPL